MSQSKQNFETSDCKASPLPDTQCRLDQWTDTPDENLPSSSSTNASTHATCPSHQSSPLTTPDELEKHPYRDPNRLCAVYEHTGTIAGTATHFDIAETTARVWLIHHGIYDPETQGLSMIAAQLEELSPEDLGLAPQGERR